MAGERQTTFKSEIERATLAQRIYGQVGNQLTVTVTQPVMIYILSQAVGTIEYRVWYRCAGGRLKDQIQNRVRAPIQRQATEDYDGSSST